MGGGSKNGPEYLLHKLLKNKAIPFKLVSIESPKIHEFKLLNRTITTVSLISPSNAANRSIGANPVYKANKKKDQSYSTFDFRLLIYKKYFPKKI